MISSLFGKTKPFNYIILFGFLTVLYVLVHFLDASLSLNFIDIAGKVGVLSLLCFSVFLVNFIVSRNKLTGPHSFVILCFTAFILLFPDVLLDNNSILCTFFLLLAHRRLLSLKSLQQNRIKIFDATLWVVVASFFYDWALLYLLLVFLAIYFYEPKNLKNWLIPFSGIVTAFILLYTVLLLFNATSYFENHFQFKTSNLESVVESLLYNAAFVILLLITVIAMILVYINHRNPGAAGIVTLRLMTISFLLGICLTFLKFNDDVNPVLVCLFPAAIFVANYIETVKKMRLKELLLAAVILLPLCMAVFSFL